MALLINIKSVVKQVVPERGSGSPVGPAEGVGGGAARGTRGVPKPLRAPKHLPGQLGQSPALGSPRYLLGDRAHVAHMDGGMLPIPGVLDPQLPPAFCSTTEPPRLLLLLPARGRGVRTVPTPGSGCPLHRRGEANSGGGTGTRRRWPERSSGARCPRASSRAWCSPRRAREPLFIAAPFFPASSCP